MRSLNYVTKQLAVLLLSICTANNVNAKDNKGVVATGGTISYTLHIGDKVVNVDTVLAGDSYIFAGEESDIVIADPCEKFYLGIVQKGGISSGNIYQLPSTAAYVPAYTLAKYLVYDAAGKTMEAKPFDNGFVTIETTDTGSYTINFMYTLFESTGEQVTLKGKAVFTAPHLAMH
jgi:hypothetical protein